MPSGPDTLKGIRDRAILATLLYHGVRREELCALRVKDVQIRAFAGRFAAQRAAGTQFRHMVSNIAGTSPETGPPAVPICWCSVQF